MFYYPKRQRVSLDCGDKMVTKQGHKDECDIHKILNQYKKTGIISHITSNQAQYIDLPNVSDYQQSLNIILEGQEAFASLPSSVRDRFHNDPAEFLSALGDPALRGELTELGIFKKPAPTPQPMKVEIVNPPAASPAS